ncbi:MAG: NAD(+)/NADH kinase [Thermodesulfobacteriota bacterium]
MKNIILVVKNDPRAVAAAEDLRQWLQQRGLEVHVDRPLAVWSRGPVQPPDFGPVDLIVVLGGDGTLLYAARTFGVTGVPLLGVNMGGLGFLTEVSLVNLRPALEQVLAGSYQAESRMTLSAEVIRDGEVITSHTVLNDAVINKGALARILDLTVKVDGADLTTYRADGLIISTPTGSTAYNLAAGGPIVHPTQELIILTPICPFTLSNRPLILPRVAVIEIAIDPQASDVLLTSDGQVSCPLSPEDRITVRRSRNQIVLIKNPYKSYFEILRTKLGWG